MRYALICLVIIMLTVITVLISLMEKQAIKVKNISPTHASYTIQAGDVLRLGYRTHFISSHWTISTMYHFSIVIQIEDELYVTHYWPSNSQRLIKDQEMIFFPHYIKLCKLKDFIKHAPYRYVIIYRNTGSQIKITWNEMLNNALQFDRAFSCSGYVAFILSRYISFKFYSAKVLGFEFWTYIFYSPKRLDRSLREHGYIVNGPFFLDNLITPITAIN